MFAASTVKRATDVKAPFLQCTTSFHVVSLTDLHSEFTKLICFVNACSACFSNN